MSTPRSTRSLLTPQIADMIVGRLQNPADLKSVSLVCRVTPSISAPDFPEIPSVDTRSFQVSCLPTQPGLQSRQNLRH